MRMPWGACFRTLRPQARKKALETWGYDTPQAALEEGNMEALKYLLKSRASVTQKIDGESAFAVAIRKRNFEAVRWIAECDAYLNARDSNGDTFLAVAAREGDLELASVLLEVGAKTEFRNKAGYSAIMWSAVKGNVAMTRLLLEHGASPNVPPRAWETHGKSPLTEAVFGGNLEVVKMLVEAGARLYDRDGLGRTPIDLAQSLATIRSPSMPTASTGASLSRTQRGGDHDVCPTSVGNKHRGEEGIAEIFGDARAIAEYLSEKFSAIEEIDWNGDTPLIRAVKRDDLEGARSLIGRGANVAAKGKYERTALLCAAMKKNLAMVKVLLENSLDAKSCIDSSDEKGRTPLMFAARDGDFQMVQFLVACGADVNTHGKIRKYTHIGARLKKRKLLISVYRRSARVETSIEVGFTALTYAAKRGHTEIVKFLIEHGADVNAKDCFDRTVLMHALNGRDCKLEIIKLLVVEHGADIHARSMDGSSAIHFAATRWMASVIAYLLEHGADIDDTNHLGFTPLMQLSKRGATSSVRLLVKKGAAVDLQEEFGRTALFFAVESGRIHIVRYLLERGAKANVRDEYTRKTALDVAREAGREDIVELLRKYGATE